MSKSSTITEAHSAHQAAEATPDMLPLIHPGEILREEFLLPLGLTAYALAKELHVPRTRMERLVREATPVTPDTALRLGRYFGTTAELWLNMQRSYDLKLQREAKTAELALIQPRSLAVG